MGGDGKKIRKDTMGRRKDGERVGAWITHFCFVNHNNKKGVGGPSTAIVPLLTESIQTVDVLVLAGGQEAVDGVEDDGV